MSRVGLGKRLSTVQAAIRTQYPFGYALHNLDANMRAKYNRWRDECANAGGHSNEAGARYAALLDGVTLGPPMPAELQAALKLDAGTRYEITWDMTVDEAAHVYQSMLDEGNRNKGTGHNPMCNTSRTA